MVEAMGTGSSEPEGSARPDATDELLRELLQEVRLLRELAAQQAQLLAAILEVQHGIEPEIVKGFL